ncbi:AfsR/SARP family transcriptional regulator [Phytoactinopolyspora alkaliphila]|uniref:AfsR/SARP family transcriptional regulator n=1 Tax=Phytoactinopolyspora alkaliphila TaxID=1783498 RepID=A0A6N9YQW0_9ACTN|nr:BTAD domain-containing putative transcriptional regulator [Phytoactinopolyspora alkaliphila]NED97372.1 AfsR/SARP family transcriptional regulator [Phytoactinopolyspora alkaliphila]
MSVAHLVDVSVLGPLEVSRAGRAVEIPGAKPRAVLIMLSLHADTVVSGGALTALLWGEHPPATARKALQTHISTLRRVLGPGVVTTRGNGWVLAPSRCDAVEFEAAVRDGREALARGAANEAAARLTEAIGAWRGAPELPQTSRGHAEVTRWIEEYESAVDDRVDAQLACNRASDLIGELEANLAETPLRERRWAQLCLALFRAGRQGDALHTYQRVRRLLADELGVEPGPELRRLESAILAQDPALLPPALPPAAASPTPAPAALDTPVTLPAPATTFVGRQDELARLATLLATHRIVTVVGPGGMGKTRLAVAAGESATAEFPAGVLFVDLAPVAAEFAAVAVAAATGVTEQPDVILEQAIHQHFDRGRALLILDNCEHVVDTVAPFVDRLTRACPNLVVLATSRERLGAAGEQVYTLPALSLVGPGTGGPKGSEAEALFLDRARAVEPGFDAEPALVGEVCARCDGLPLAIELAAARAASLGIDGLLTALDDNLRALVGSRGSTGRHRSVRTVLDWSHELLDPDERVLFRRIGMFAGAFDLTAALAVGTDGQSPAAVIDILGRLTDKSLLVHVRTPSGSRWRLLAVVRAYARDKLAASGEWNSIQARYLTWASTTAAELEHQLNTGGPWRDEFDTVTGDLRAALHFEVTAASDTGTAEQARDRLTLALALARLHARSGAFTLAEHAYEEAMGMARASNDADLLAQAALGASETGMLFGVAQTHRIALLDEALAAHAGRPTALRVRLLARFATELYWSPERDRSLAMATEAVSLAEELRDDGALAHALYARHYVTRSPGEWRASLALAERVTQTAQRSGETLLELAGLAAQVIGQLQAGEMAAMADRMETLLEAASQRDHPEFQWYATVYRMVNALLTGDFSDADELAATAETHGKGAPEFAIGLFFAQVITDLRELDTPGHVQRTARLAEMADQFPRVLVWRCLRVLHVLDRPAWAAEEATALLGELLAEDPRGDHWLVGSCLLAEAAAELGDVRIAKPLAEALRPFAGQIAVAGRVAACRGSVSHALGLLALTLGQADAAVVHFDEATSQHERLGAQPFIARSREALERARGHGAGHV